VAAIVRDPAPRAVSPILFILAGLCFLLPFTGVSCNTGTARSEVTALSALAQQSGGAGSGFDARAMNSCLDSLTGYNLWTYSGANLVVGSKPDVATRAPAGCDKLSSESGGAPTTPAANPDAVALGVQPLLVAALAAMLLGLVLSLFRYALRGLAVAASAVAAIILLLVANGSVGSQAMDKVRDLISNAAGSAGGAGAFLQGVDLSSFFSVTMGIGLILAIVALAVCAAYNLAAELTGLIAGRLRTAPAAAGAGPPHPAGTPPDTVERPSWQWPPPSGPGDLPPPPPPPALQSGGT
jgi:lysylphosphatidylglycerol synthetase-like protein (DUF2156 family)